MKHLLKMSDMSKDDIMSVLNLADQLKYELSTAYLTECSRAGRLA